MPPETVWLVDSTLRDGEQAAGVAFTPEERREIAERLVAIGVPELEAVICGMDEAAQDDLACIAHLRDECRVTGWCRCRLDDLIAADNLGLRAVHISVPASPRHLRALGKSHSWVFRQLENLVPEARRRFPFVSVGVQDAPRAGLRFLFEVAEAVDGLGAQRLRMADTVGVWQPFAVKSAFAQLRQAAPTVRLGFHGHNDLGLATANALAAVNGGAQDIDVTVNGLGERAGNVALEQFVLGLDITMHRSCAIEASGLQPLCEFVAEASRTPIPIHAPITGERAFRHESGLHASAVTRDELTYQAFTPETVGRAPREIVAGKHSGRSSIQYLLSRRGFAPNGRQLARLMPRVRAEALRHRRALDEDAVAALYATLDRDAEP